jgi:hypothetical protein
MRTGCGAHHGFREGRDARGAGLRGGTGFGLGARARGVGWVRAGYEWHAGALETWQHRDGGGGQAPKPRDGCGSSRRALRATTGPVRLNIDGNGVFLVESATDFVADGAENAGHNGAFAIGGHRP